jgi:SAM-dependent methyltransferase
MRRKLKRKLATWYISLLDFMHRPLVRPTESDPVHKLLPKFQALVGAIENPDVLELGSRNVTGVTRRHLFPAARYVGFDFHPGENVDVVGDCHQLSKHFAPNSFDAVYCVAVFEHLAYPWKVVLEINKILKPGGYVYVATHPCWPAHELPWDFWRFPVAGLSSLFVPPLGFDLVDAVEGLPCKPYSLVTEPPTRAFYRYTINSCVAAIARKTGDFDPSRFKWELDVVETLRSRYPSPE